MSDPFEEWKSARGKEPMPSSVPAGTVIGEYRVLGLVGRGGSAEVYSATHVKLGATVAIKILHKFTEHSRIRFDREAKILSGATHPCFPQFKSCGEFEGRPYIVTELLGPCELPRTDKEVAEFLLKVLDGVGCLHRLGFVHRDIKPANILMRNGEEPVLTDFGLACPISAPRQIMGRISIVNGRPAGVGTPGYAAPEQFEGGEVSAATDVHAVGMLADECFGGKPPRCWRPIIDRATNSRRNVRFSTAKEFARTIRTRHARSYGTVLVIALLAMFAFLGVLRETGNMNGGAVKGPVDGNSVNSNPAVTGGVKEQVPASDELIELFGVRFGMTPAEWPRHTETPVFRRFTSPLAPQTTSLSDQAYAFTMWAQGELMKGMSLEDIGRECLETIEELQRRYSIDGVITNTVNPDVVRRQRKTHPFGETFGKDASPLKYEYVLSGRGCSFRVEGDLSHGHPIVTLHCRNERLGELARKEAVERKRLEKDGKEKSYADDDVV